MTLAESTTIKPTAANPVLGSSAPLEQTERVATLARRPGVSLRDLLTAAGATDLPADEALAAAEIELKYDGYIARERAAAERLGELAAFALPADVPYPELLSLSTEARQKLAQIKPTSLAQAARIPGVSPSDLHNLVFEVSKRRRMVA